MQNAITVKQAVDSSETPQAEWVQPGRVRGDSRLIAKAVRQGWNVPGSVKSTLVARLADAINGADNRELAAIASALTGMDRCDIAAARLEFDRERGSATNDITFRIVRDTEP
jgi:hypothetical protein